MATRWPWSDAPRRDNCRPAENPPSDPHDLRCSAVRLLAQLAGDEDRMAIVRFNAETQDLIGRLQPSAPAPTGNLFGAEVFLCNEKAGCPDDSFVRRAMSGMRRTKTWDICGRPSRSPAPTTARPCRTCRSASPPASFSCDLPQRFAMRGIPRLPE